MDCNVLELAIVCLQPKANAIVATAMITRSRMCHRKKWIVSFSRLDITFVIFRTAHFLSNINEQTCKVDRRCVSRVGEGPVNSDHKKVWSYFSENICNPFHPQHHQARMSEKPPPNLVVNQAKTVHNDNGECVAFWPSPLHIGGRLNDLVRMGSWRFFFWHNCKALLFKLTVIPLPSAQPSRSLRWKSTLDANIWQKRTEMLTVLYIAVASSSVLKGHAFRTQMRMHIRLEH